MLGVRPGLAQPLGASALTMEPWTPIQTPLPRKRVRTWSRNGIDGLEQEDGSWTVDGAVPTFSTGVVSPNWPATPMTGIGESVDHSSDGWFRRAGYWIHLSFRNLRWSEGGSSKPIFGLWYSDAPGRNAR